MNNRDIHQVTQRIQASFDVWKQHEYQDGQIAGIVWAQHSSEYSHLHNLWRFQHALEQDPTEDWAAFFDQHDESVTSLADIIVEVILRCPTGSGDAIHAARFWESVGIEIEPSNYWLRGFCDAAIEVFEPVIRRLDYKFVSVL